MTKSDTKEMKVMPSGCIVVPMPGIPGRYCAWDPTSNKYLTINQPRQSAEAMAASVHPENWEIVAKQHGWGPLPKADDSSPDPAELNADTDNDADDTNKDEGGA